VDYELEGAAVLVTGAASGIGLGIARAFAAQGARVALADRDGGRLETVASSFAAGSECEFIACDLGDDSQVQALANALSASFGSLDVLVNNAGVEYPTPIQDRAPDAMERWSGLLENNVGSMMRTVRALLPLLGRNSSIINQGSIWGLTGVPGFSAYVASKHAVIGLTRSLAWELAPRGIRVNAVCPGWVRTEAAMRSLGVIARAEHRSEQDMLDDILSAQAIPSLLEPEDIADVYLYLASPGARSITGQSIVAAHGEVMH
jgi:3-hydroxybutyrate dehydrogenase